MQKKIIILPIIFCLFLLSINSFSQNYIQDTLAVRAILDSNGLYDIPVDYVTDSSGNRIVEFDLSQYEKCMTTLLPEIENLTNLEILNLSYSRLINLPTEIGNLTNLEILNLSYSDLISLPTEIGNLTNLVKLNLSYNDLIILPEPIINLTPWEELDVGYNKISINYMTHTMFSWLHEFDPDWRETQDTITAIIFMPNNKASGLFLNAQKKSILFNVPPSGDALLHIGDMKGRIVTTLFDSYKQAGKYRVNWDTHKYGSALYYLKLSTGDNTLIQKAVIMK